MTDLTRILRRIRERRGLTPAAASIATGIDWPSPEAGTLGASGEVVARVAGLFLEPEELSLLWGAAKPVPADDAWLESL